MDIWIFYYPAYLTQFNVITPSPVVKTFNSIPNRFYMLQETYQVP